MVTSDFSQAMKGLEDGRRVLFMAHGVKTAYAKQTGFESVYWSAGWFKGDKFASLGIICDPGHPALADFPNEGHSDWQWWGLTRNATTFLLDGAPKGFRPIVQLVPDFHFNKLLGHVFQCRIGQGRLLVCGYDISSNLEKRHAARQLRQSLLNYIQTNAFSPQYELSLEFLKQLFE